MGGSQWEGRESLSWLGKTALPVSHVEVDDGGRPAIVAGPLKSSVAGAGPEKAGGSCDQREEGGLGVSSDSMVFGRAEEEEEARRPQEARPPAFLLPRRRLCPACT